MDPLSITASVATLLAICVNVSIPLRKFRNEAAEIRTTFTALLTDVKALRQVLQSMEDTFEELDNDKPQTGHIGAHWNNLSRSLQDGQVSLARLESLLNDANKDVAIFDTIRRTARLRTVADQVAGFRQEIQTYKDTLQLSLQTMTFWNQLSVKQDTAEILSTSHAMHQDIERLAINLDVKLTALHSMFQTHNQQIQLEAVNNLRDTVRSAATVISSASTVLSPDNDAPAEMPDYMSDFGDWFRSEPSQSTLQWVYGDYREEILVDPRETNRPPSPYEAIPPISNAQQQRSTAFPSLPAVSQNSSSLTLRNNGAKPEYPSEPEAPKSEEYQFKRFEQILDTVEQPPPPPASPSVFRGFGRRKKPEQLTPTSPTSQNKGGLFHRSSLSLTQWRSPSPRYEQPYRDDRLLSPIGLSPPINLPKPTPKSIRLKFVFVGDGACGKTCLLIRGSKGSMPEIYVPTVFENYCADFSVDGIAVEMSLWDTAGQDDFDKLRPLGYPDSHAFVVCFSIDSPDSLYNVREKWASEVRQYDKKHPIFLVGCKSDLRYDARTIADLLRAGQYTCKEEEGMEAARDIGAALYLETSAKTGEGVLRMFEETIRFTLRDRAMVSATTMTRMKKGLFGRLFG